VTVRSAAARVPVMTRVVALNDSAVIVCPNAAASVASVPLPSEVILKLPHEILAVGAF